MGIWEHFNSRPSARGDLLVKLYRPENNPFQFTPLREGRPPSWAPFAQNVDFNSRPSARGDVSGTKTPQQLFVFQFTPLREGRQFSCPQTSLCKGISIHAPPRGATSTASCSSTYSLLFQFTPLREGRRAIVRRVL